MHGSTFTRCLVAAPAFTLSLLVASTTWWGRLPKAILLGAGIVSLGWALLMGALGGLQASNRWSTARRAVGAHAGLLVIAVLVLAVRWLTPSGLCLTGEPVGSGNLADLEWCMGELAFVVASTAMLFAVCCAFALIGVGLRAKLTGRDVNPPR
jgi:hypothetical protein